MLYTITAINGNKVTLDRPPPSSAYGWNNGIVIDAICLDKPHTIIVSNPHEYGICVGGQIRIDARDRLGSDKALRYNEGKLRWSLIDWKSMEPMVQVLEFGAKKYSEDNWKNAMDKKQILNSAMRHLIAMMNGEEIDPESGLPHAGHVHCNMMFYSYHSQNNDSK